LASAAKISRRQLDRQLEAVFEMATPVPPRGWVRAIRSALGMTMRQMASRMDGSASAVAAIEANEASGALTLRRLRAAAEALDCEVFYVLVPKSGSLEATLRRRAEAVAQGAVRHADRHMRVEDQGVDEPRLREHVDDLVADLLREPPARLWDPLP